MSPPLLVQENVVTELCMWLVEELNLVSQLLAKTKLIFISYKDSKHVLGNFCFRNSSKHEF